MRAICPDCGWTMQADDADEAEVLLGVHQVVKMNAALNA